MSAFGCYRPHIARGGSSLYAALGFGDSSWDKLLSGNASKETVLWMLLDGECTYAGINLLSLGPQLREAALELYHRGFLAQREAHAQPSVSGVNWQCATVSMYFDLQLTCIAALLPVWARRGLLVR